NLYTMYHGTSREAAASILKTGFRQSSGGMLGRGVYLSKEGQPVMPFKQGRVQVSPWRTNRLLPLRDASSTNCELPKRLGVNDFLPPGQPRLESLVAPGDNKIYTMYHGISREAAASILKTGFRQSSGGMLGRGVYLSRDLQKASRYPLELPESQRVVLRVRVNVGRVKKIDCQGHPLQKTWHDQGYDTAWCPPGCGMVKSELEEDCVWDPNRIGIIDVIYPKPGACGGYGAARNFYLKMWAENDFPPPGQPRLDSFVAPVDNRVYTMYHGTSRKAADSILKTGIRRSRGGMLGPGVYLSRDLQKASRYPLDLPEHERVVLRVKVAVGRVIAINYQGHPLQHTWHDYGYDTAWCPPNCGMVPSGLEEDCVWDPNRIEILNVILPKSGAYGAARGFYR
ncbi:uncharacterized protein LOC143121328, partial [Alosa pseudoharengus]|uniref:uncharacterized protein LOC143121328 n=1 Tax=Alosa pseudoharengus TaxID=34774 RepID=UPI003F89EBBF